MQGRATHSCKPRQSALPTTLLLLHLTRPAVALSYVIAGVVAGLSAMCYMGAWPHACAHSAHQWQRHMFLSHVPPPPPLRSSLRQSLQQRQRPRAPAWCTRERLIGCLDGAVHARSAQEPCVHVLLLHAPFAAFRCLSCRIFGKFVAW